MARPSRTSGVARSVERRARPAVVSVMKDLRQPPITVGSEKGNGPTERTRPTKIKHDEVGPLAPAHEAAATSEKTGTAYEVAKSQALGVAGRRVGPRARGVAAVEVPVAQAADHLGGVRGGRGRRDGLGVLEDVDPVSGLDQQAGHPPQACAQGEDADAQRGVDGLAPGRLAAGRRRRRSATGSGATPT